MIIVTDCRRSWHRYNEWLKSLMPGERAQLLDLPTDERTGSHQGNHP